MATYSEEKVNRGDITNIYREGILRDPNDNDFAAWDGKSWKQFTYDLVARGDFAKKRFEQADASFKQVYSQLQDSEKARADQLTEINDLKAKLASAGGGIDKETKDQIAETNNIVKQIWNKITSIFK